MPTPSKQAKQALNQAILALEEARNSKVIVYMTGDKQPLQIFATQVASDILLFFKKVLQNIDQTKKITLALYTNGGHLETPWPLVNLIREHCKDFEVVVLEKALSAGTMIALGADQIVMGRYAHLSPIDPAANISIANNQTKQFEIEDIIGYIDFVKDKIGVTEQNALCEIMKDLTKEIAPTLLGSANRTHSLVRRLAKSLLRLHKGKVSEGQSKEIIEHLTQKLYSHKHLINRNEAKEIGFDEIVEFPDKRTEKIIEKLFETYSLYLELEGEFDAQTILGRETTKEITVNRAVVHSSKLKFSFQTKCVITKIPDPSGKNQFNVNATSHKWSIL